MSAGSAGSRSSGRATCCESKKTPSPNAPKRANQEHLHGSHTTSVPVRNKQNETQNDCNTNTPQSGLEKRMAEGPGGSSSRRKGTHPQARRTESAAPRVAVG